MSEYELKSSVTFYPYTDVDIIKISRTPEQSEKDAWDSKDEMGAGSVMMTDFDRNVTSAYYLFTEGETVFSIFKRTPNQKYYKYICTLSDGDYSFFDYNINSNEFYHYLTSVELIDRDEATGEVRPSYYIYENTDDNEENAYYHVVFDSWSICDVEEADEDGVYIKKGHTWELGLNMEGENITQNLNIAAWDTLGRYPKISMGNRNYDSMSFSGLLGKMFEYDETVAQSFAQVNENNITYKPKYGYTEKMETFNQSAALSKTNGAINPGWNVWDPYAREVDKLKAWKEFMADGEIKLLKDTKGNSWLVQVVDSTSYSINGNTNLAQTVVSFSWKEVEDVSHASIVRYGDREDG